MVECYRNLYLLNRLPPNLPSPYLSDRFQSSQRLVNVLLVSVQLACDVSDLERMKGDVQSRVFQSRLPAGFFNKTKIDSKETNDRAPVPTSIIHSYLRTLYRSLAANVFTIVGPSRIDSFEDEHCIIDGAVYIKSLRHIQFVWVHVNKLPRSQNRCGKQDGEFPLLRHPTSDWDACFQQL